MRPSGKGERPDRDEFLVRHRIMELTDPMQRGVGVGTLVVVGKIVPDGLLSLAVLGDDVHQAQVMHLIRREYLCRA